MAALSTAPLRERYVAQNKVPAIRGLAALTGLTVLELGSNRIRTVEGLEAQGGLAELWLGRNRIGKIEGLSHLANLVRVSLQSNRWAAGGAVTVGHGRAGWPGLGPEWILPRTTRRV